MGMYVCMHVLLSMYVRMFSSRAGDHEIDMVGRKLDGNLPAQFLNNEECTKMGVMQQRNVDCTATC